jgi:hypothetical protein
MANKANDFSSKNRKAARATERQAAAAYIEESYAADDADSYEEAVFENDEALLDSEAFSLAEDAHLEALEAEEAEADYFETWVDEAEADRYALEDF